MMCRQLTHNVELIGDTDGQDYCRGVGIEQRVRHNVERSGAKYPLA